MDFCFLCFGNNGFRRRFCHVKKLAKRKALRDEVNIEAARFSIWSALAATLAKGVARQLAAALWIRICMRICLYLFVFVFIIYIYVCVMHQSELLFRSFLSFFVCFDSLFYSFSDLFFVFRCVYISSSVFFLFAFKSTFLLYFSPRGI